MWVRMSMIGGVWGRKREKTVRQGEKVRVISFGVQQENRNEF